MAQRDSVPISSSFQFGEQVQHGSVPSQPSVNPSLQEILNPPQPSDNQIPHPDPRIQLLKSLGMSDQPLTLGSPNFSGNKTPSTPAINPDWTATLSGNIASSTPIINPDWTTNFSPSTPIINPNWTAPPLSIGEEKVKKTRQRYDFDFKLSVVDYALQNSIHAAHQIFCIDRSQIRHWIRNAQSIRATVAMGGKDAQRTRLHGAGRPVAWKSVDDKLFVFYQEEVTRTGQTPSKRDLRSAAWDFFQELVDKGEAEAHQFRASDGWLERWYKRYEQAINGQPPIVYPQPLTRKGPRKYVTSHCQNGEPGIAAGDCVVIGCESRLRNLEKFKEQCAETTVGCELPFELFPFPDSNAERWRFIAWLRLVGLVEEAWSEKSRVCSRHFKGGTKKEANEFPTENLPRCPTKQYDKRPSDAEKIIAQTSTISSVSKVVDELKELRKHRMPSSCPYPVNETSMFLDKILNPLIKQEPVDTEAHTSGMASTSFASTLLQTPVQHRPAFEASDVVVPQSLMMNMPRLSPVSTYGGHSLQKTSPGDVASGMESPATTFHSTDCKSPEQRIEVYEGGIAVEVEMDEEDEEEEDEPLPSLQAEGRVQPLLMSPTGQIHFGRPKGAKKRSYSLQTKLDVIAFAKANSKNEASRRFGLDRRQVQEWCKKEEQIKKECLLSGSTSAKSRLSGGGRKEVSQELNDLVFHWLQKERETGVKLSRRLIKSKALEIGTELIKKGALGAGFSASNAWLLRFLERYNLDATEICVSKPRERSPSQQTSSSGDAETSRHSLANSDDTPRLEEGDNGATNEDTFPERRAVKVEMFTEQTDIGNIIPEQTLAVSPTPPTDNN